MDERKALCENVVLQFGALIAAQAEHIIGQKLHLVGVHSVFVKFGFHKIPPCFGIALVGYGYQAASMTPMSSDAIEALLADTTFSMRNNYGGDGDGTHTITFHADGTLDASYTYEGAEYSMYEAWRMEGDSVVCTHSYASSGEQKTTDYYFTPYQYDETRYLLLDQNGDYSMALTTFEG